MATKQSDLLVLSLPELVGIINSRLEELTGAKIPFVLLVADDNKALCSSNVNGGQREALLEQWEYQCDGTITRKTPSLKFENLI